MKNFDLNIMEKRNPFSVPDGYFENLTARVMAQIPETPQAEGESQSETKIIRIDQGSHRKTSQKFVGWSIAAAACIAAAAFFLHVPEQNNMMQATAKAESLFDNTDDEEYQQEILEYAMVDNSDIYSYLSGAI